MNIREIGEKLSKDGDLRQGDDNYLYEVQENDDLGFYQTACQFLINRIGGIQQLVDIDKSNHPKKGKEERGKKSKLEFRCKVAERTLWVLVDKIENSTSEAIFEMIFGEGATPTDIISECHRWAEIEVNKKPNHPKG